MGAGIGGLTLATELRRRGLDPQVYEQAAELREVGAAVALSANATRFLRDRLGIGEQLAEKAADIDGLIFRDGRDGHVIGRVSSRQEYHDRTGAPYYGVHRADLQLMLKEALGEDALHLNKKCVRVDDREQAAVLHFADGDTVEADLVIGADGVRSRLRRELLGYDDAQFSGCHGWRGVVPPEQIPSLPDPESIQFWMGPDGHLLHYPIGNGDQNFLLVRRHDGPWAEKSWVVPAEEDEHLTAFEGWDPAVTEMIGSAPATQRWALFHRPPLQQWSRGRITLIGDAAHAMVPHHGQGANQSIEDAIVLADCLLEGLGQGTGWDTARQRYEDLRAARVRRVQITSLATADVLHLPDGPRAEARNARLGAADFWERSLAWIHEHVADRVLTPVVS
ncbi:salicylate hydroxylase [Corynebacterium halotolerans YIM 70093 = DSM 44683]|uniref:Salicylate hydroxylase n=1 Tax=Corynebacterium halotolerans YIM 70093 = DSM 44683 TaxID=1121362 RepID=M1NYI0_9CORY|nr:salicylate hydroxylase [Corynebacterium halotolerans YIM 70093 = DSM 44683]